MPEFRSAIDEVRDELFLDRAEGRYLDTIGENVGLTRPRGGLDDDTWRQVLRIVMMSPKSVKERFEALLTALAADTVALSYLGDPLTAPPDLRVEVLLDGAAPPTTRPLPPAIALRLTGEGLPADAPIVPGPGIVTITATGFRVGTPGSPSPSPAPGPEVIVTHALDGQTGAALHHTPMLPATVEVWVNPRTPAVATPVSLATAFYTVDPDGSVTFDVLPAPLTFFALDPATNALVPRPGLPGGAEVLAVYQIDTRTYAGLAAALRLILPPTYRVEIPDAARPREWTDLDALDAQMFAEQLPTPAGPDGPAAPRFARLIDRIDLRSWAIYDAGRSVGPPDDQPTTPFLDQDTVGPRVFVDLRRRDDLGHPRGDRRQASYVHDDLEQPAPGAPHVWEIHPWNASGNRALLGTTDPGFHGPYVYSHDDRLQPYGQEAIPGDPRSWVPFPEEFITVLVVNPATGAPEPVTVRQDRHATNLFTGGPLETAPGSGVFFKDFAKPRLYAPREDRGDLPLVLFTDDFWLERLKLVFDLVRAAGVFVTFERSSLAIATTPPAWFCDPCYTPARPGPPFYPYQDPTHLVPPPPGWGATIDYAPDPASPAVPPGSPEPGTVDTRRYGET